MLVMAAAFGNVPPHVLNGEWYRDEEEYAAWKRECEEEEQAAAAAALAVTLAENPHLYGRHYHGYGGKNTLRLPLFLTPVFRS